MKLKEQNLQKRIEAKKLVEAEAKKAQIIQDYVNSLTPDRLAHYQKKINHIKAYVEQNPYDPIFMAHVSHAVKLKDFIFRPNITAQELATVLHDYGEVVFLDQEINPIDGKNVKMIEITKTVEIPLKKDEVPISTNKINKILAKIQHGSKKYPAYIQEGMEKFLQLFKADFDKL